MSSEWGQEPVMSFDSLSILFGSSSRNNLTTQVSTSQNFLTSLCVIEMSFQLRHGVKVLEASTASGFICKKLESRNLLVYTEHVRSFASSRTAFALATYTSKDSVVLIVANPHHRHLDPVYGSEDASVPALDDANHKLGVLVVVEAHCGDMLV